MRMAKLLQTGIGRQSRCPRRQQPGHEAGRSDMFALWWAPGTRLSRRSAPYRAALLYQFGFAEAGAEYQVITTETPRHRKQFATEDTESTEDFLGVSVALW